MPVIVIGADTAVGEAVITTLLPTAAEVRAFISREASAAALRARGVKVACGDVSDHSHVEAAALNCFCAILVTEAADDGRAREFAPDARTVLQGWATAIRRAGLRRAIWVSSAERQAPFPDSVPEVATVTVGDDIRSAADRIAHLEELAELPHTPGDGW